MSSTSSSDVLWQNQPVSVVSGPQLSLLLVMFLANADLDCGQCTEKMQTRGLSQEIGSGFTGNKARPLGNVLQSSLPAQARQGIMRLTRPKVEWKMHDD